MRHSTKPSRWRGLRSPKDDNRYPVPRSLLLTFASVAALASFVAAGPTATPEPERETEIPNAVVGVKAMFRNEKDEILLVFDDRRQAWEVPGTTHQGQATARNLIDALASELGITYTGLGLRGLFTYHNPQTGTTIVRPYYTAQFRGFLDGKALKDSVKSKWFSLAEVKKVVPYPASVQIVDKLSRQPEHVWAAAFEEYGYTSPMTDRTAVKFRVLEDFYELK